MKGWKRLCVMGWLLPATMLSLLLGQDLDFWTTQDYDYVLRQSNDSLALVQSNDPTLAPWLPERQVGWQFVDDTSFFYCFEANNASPRALNFQRDVILGIVRNDPYAWDIDVQSARVDPDNATIHFTYSLRQVGNPLPRPHLQSLVIGLVPHKHMAPLGLRNWTFIVEEIRLNVPPEIPHLDPSETIMFPPFFSLNELKQALPILRNSW